MSSEALRGNSHSRAYECSSLPHRRLQQKQPKIVDIQRPPSTDFTVSKKFTSLKPEIGAETKETQPLPQLHHELIGATAVEKHSARSGESPRGSNAAMDMRSAPPAPNVSMRPSTAPAAGAVPSERPGVGVDGVTQGSTNESAVCEEAVNASRLHDAGWTLNGDNLWIIASAGSNQRSGGRGGVSDCGSPTHPPFDTREEYTREDPPPSHGNSDLMTENAFETEHDYVSLGPATVEAARRPTIEADAALSRSPRLLASPSSMWPRSEGVTTSLSGTMIGNEGGCQENNGEKWRNNANIDEEYLKTTEPSAEMGAAGHTSLVTRTGLTVNGGAGSRKGRGTGGDSGGNANKQKMNRSHLRMGGGGPGLHHQQRHDSKMASTPRSGSIYNTSRITEGGLSGPSISSLAAQAIATGTSWTEWARPGECGERDVRADTRYGRNGRGGRYAAGRARNGAATGAGWGGYDQV